MSEPTKALEWLWGQRKDADNHVEEILDHIEDLKADSEQLDTLREWLKTGSAPGIPGSEYTTGYVQAICDVAGLIEESNHD